MNIRQLQYFVDLSETLILQKQLKIFILVKQLLLNKFSV